MNEIEIDKKLVINRFTKSLHTYDQEATAQRAIARKLLSLTKEQFTLNEAINTAIEIGAGTGYLSKLIVEQLQPNTLYINDLCPAMEVCYEPLVANHNARVMIGDAEQLDLPQPSDLVISSSVLQWFCDPATFFDRCATSLRSGGMIAFSTFGTRNMEEVREVTGEGLRYAERATWEEYLGDKFEIVHTSEQTIQMRFDSPKEVLRHLKLTGVTGSSTTPRQWTRGDLARFDYRYRELFEYGEKVSLTYHPIYIVARKR